MKNWLGRIQSRSHLIHYSSAAHYYAKLTRFKAFRMHRERTPLKGTDFAD